LYNKKIIENKICRRTIRTILRMAIKKNFEMTKRKYDAIETRK
jgi:hypothetical protein